MLIEIVRGAPSTLLGVPALLAIGARAELWLVLAGTAVALLLAGAVRWLAWSRFTYALTADAVVIESGVLSRNRRTIPYERVADVGIERRLLQRLFGLAKVTLETGGAGADEGLLDSVSSAEAERLRNVLRQRRQTAQKVLSTAPDEGAPAPGPGTPLFAMSVPRVLLWGLFNFSLVWIAVGFGALQYLDGPLDVDSSELWKAAFAESGTVRSLPASALAGAIAAAGAIVLAVGIVAGVIRTTLREHGFTLTGEDGRLRRRRGLFTQSDAIIPLPRVQLAAIDSGPLRRRLGWSRLRAQLLGGDGAKGQQDLAPFARQDEVDRLLDVLRLRRAHPADMVAVARGHVWRALLRGVALPALLIAGATLVTPLALLASPLLLPLVAIALLDRRHHRYRLASGLLQVQRGVIGRATWIVPIARVQTVTLRRSWLQRRLGLASVLVDTAGGARLQGPNVHDLRLADGRALVDQLCRVDHAGHGDVTAPSLGDASGMA
ncbi:PH domain-containing protein [Sphingomonas sp.]|uniref:PH domain-containing protein n=1 Tax=Sphingomonas sp. TaxID=28214 RepID=UPI002D8006DA|nr:PH domain-containing protein [Sphingomonas sp.]HEU0044232.1 PH domain-containing protein [Sphingomonas sp.]